MLIVGGRLKQRVYLVVVAGLVTFDYNACSEVTLEHAFVQSGTLAVEIMPI
jgi:hypothetical protein